MYDGVLVAMVVMKRCESNVYSGNKISMIWLQNEYWGDRKEETRDDSCLRS